jgi:hypothetical protein
MVSADQRELLVDDKLVDADTMGIGAHMKPRCSSPAHADMLLKKVIGVI